jgi:hypothetical protein
MTLAEINGEAARLKAFLESWRRAWESKDFKTYRSCTIRVPQR